MDASTTASSSTADLGARRRSGPARAPLTPVPDDVARVLGHLAQLIDGSLAVRGVGGGVRAFAAAFLATRPAEIVATTRPLGALPFQLTALALAEAVLQHRPSAVIGDDIDTPPRWTTISLDDENLRFPIELAAGFDAGTLAERPLVLTVAEEYGVGLRISAWCGVDDVEVADHVLDELIERGRTGRNPFRGRCLQARWHQQIGISLSGAALPSGDRDDLVLPDDLWAELDRNVAGLFAELDRLEAAGLATSRGVLLCGPPGTGKTAACRALAREVVGEVTVLFAEAAVVSHSVESLYEQARALAPSLVVLEDVDLVVGHRGRGSGEALQAFLVTLDGAITHNRGVVTLATTNAPEAIDPAARRAARFDRVLDVPLPDRPARTRILGRHLERLDGPQPAAAAAVAAATEGWSGAELRALVGDAVLQAGGGPVTTEILLAVARRDAAARRIPGAYL